MAVGIPAGTAGTGTSAGSPDTAATGAAAVAGPAPARASPAGRRVDRVRVTAHRSGPLARRAVVVRVGRRRPGTASPCGRGAPAPYDGHRACPGEVDATEGTLEREHDIGP